MLEVRDLSFSYRRGGEELFGGLTHTFTHGAVTAVAGASGRGKSTLLYILGLLLRPSRGVVAIDGLCGSDLTDLARSNLRALHIGFVFQDAALDPSRTILDAIIEPALYSGSNCSKTTSRALDLLAQLGVQHRASHRPGQISGGQAQRVAVCRALINDPAIVLADEPTGNLDRENAETVLDELRRAAGAGTTVVIATHDPFVIDRADEVLAL